MFCPSVEFPSSRLAAISVKFFLVAHMRLVKFLKKIYIFAKPCGWCKHTYIKFCICRRRRRRRRRRRQPFFWGRWLVKTFWSDKTRQHKTTWPQPSHKKSLDSALAVLLHARKADWSRGRRITDVLFHLIHHANMVEVWLNLMTYTQCPRNADQDCVEICEQQSLRLTMTTNQITQKVCIHFFIHSLTYSFTC